MKKYFSFLVFIIGALAACRNNDNNVQLRILKQQLNNAIDLLKSDNNQVYREMDQKLQDPLTKAKAEIWQPRVKEVSALTDQIIQRIDSLIKTINHQQRNLNTQEEIELYQRLLSFEKKVKDAVKPESFSENPILSRDVSRKRDELTLSTFAGLSSDNNKQQQLVSYFNNTGILGASTMLYKIQFDVLDYCHSMVTYFNAMVNHYSDAYDSFSYIATLSSSYLKKGQTLTVYTGVGAFSIASKPSFTINNVNVLPSNGVATYNVIIDKSPGNYTIPLKVDYTGADGVKRTEVTTLKYTVAN
ncbi:MAG: hypothetical protein QM726_25985 [Chitinophagaceae bacterium]